MSRAPFGLLACLSLGACAQPQFTPRPLPPAADVAPNELPAPRGVGTFPGEAPPQRSQALVRSTDSTAAAIDRRLANDSLADAALLSILSEVTPLGGLPNLVLDDVAPLMLNATAFAGHPRVQYWVDYFSGTAHDRFQIWLDRMPRYEELIRSHLNANQLPGDLIHLALIESGFSNVAVSTAKAVGMWQFMVGTGKEYGLAVDAWVDERRDPVQASDAAARHLRDLTARFGSYYLAAAAYNAGAGRVGRGLTQLGVARESESPDTTPDLTNGDAFFSLADTRLIMQETKDYVPKLIAATLIATQPEAHGFTVDRAVDPFPIDSVMVDGGTGLDLIARLAESSFEALRELNPHLLKAVAPPTVASYPIRVPAGTAARVAEAYAELPPLERLALRKHTVTRGETVASIAKATETDAEEIRLVNRAARGSALAVGTVLYLPRTTIPMALLRDAGTATATATHVVKSGETLSGIAKRYGMTVATLQANNRLGKSTMIRAGQRLTVAASSALATTTAAVKPAAATASKTLPTSGGTRIHVVKAGETVSGIAVRYGVSQSRLVSLNGLGAARKIVVGQKLKIPA